MNLVLDAGALVGIDRDDRRIAGLLEVDASITIDGQHPRLPLATADLSRG